jgi:hypothetical protein
MKGFALLLAAASLAAAPLAAQTPVRVGQTVTGTLEAGDAQLDDGAYFDAYVLRGRPGERVLVRMRSSDFDTYLRWGYEAEGDWVEEASNDDSGDGTDSRLVVTLSGEGEYELRASGFDEDEAGAYELEVSAAASVAPGRIRVGQSVRGEITEDDAEGEEGFEDHYVFTGSAGQWITIFAESDEIDTYVLLGRDEGGEFREIDSDDDGGGGTNSQLVAELDDDGAFHVVVRSFMGDETGSYTLRIEEGATEPVVDEDDFDGEGYEGEDFTGMGEEAELPWEGSFIGPVRAGRDVRGTLGEGHEGDELVQFYHDYTYRAAAGERLVIRVSSDEIDSYVSLGTGTGDDFGLIVEDDDSGEGLNAELEFEVEEAGEYTIRVTSAYAGMVGAYVLRVESER